jgi:hypothetical protein
MKKPAYPVTRHARDRSSSRLIPEMVAEIIIDFGESEDAGDGARKYVLTKESMRDLRRAAGRAIANAVSPYRRRHAYVVAAGGRVITVAYSSHPLFD